MDTTIREIEQHFGIRLKQVTATEWRSTQGCPECGDGGKGHRSDRFRVFMDESPRWWCRRCGFFGFADTINDDRWRDLNRDERRRRIVAAQEREATRREEERAMRRSSLDAMRESGAADEYHRRLALAPVAVDYWRRGGFSWRTMSHFQLGYCEACPLDYPNHRPSVTIPVRSQGYLWNIRHRILGAGDGDKYRPHAKNLPVTLFNADELFDAPTDYILVVEGEKKAMAAWQAGWPAVGICGQDTFNVEWVAAFHRFERVIVILDPDAWNNAQEIAELFDHRGVAVQLPDKLDDLLNPYLGGWSPEDVWFEIESIGVIQ